MIRQALFSWRSRNRPARRRCPRRADLGLHAPIAPPLVALAHHLDLLVVVALDVAPVVSARCSRKSFTNSSCWAGDRLQFPLARGATWCRSRCCVARPRCDGASRARELLLRDVDRLLGHLLDQTRGSRPRAPRREAREQTDDDEVRRDRLTASPPGRTPIVELLALPSCQRDRAPERRGAGDRRCARRCNSRTPTPCILDLLQHEGALVDRVDHGAPDVILDEEGRPRERVVDPKPAAFRGSTPRSADVGTAGGTPHTRASARSPPGARSGPAEAGSKDEHPTVVLTAKRDVGRCPSLACRRSFTRRSGSAGCEKCETEVRTQRATPSPPARDGAHVHVTLSLEPEHLRVESLEDRARCRPFVGARGPWPPRARHTRAAGRTAAAPLVLLHGAAVDQLAITRSRTTAVRSSLSGSRLSSCCRAT